MIIVNNPAASANRNPNTIINGNPTINQRGYVSGTATSAANQYTLDRWRVVVSGQSISWTDSNNVRTVTAPAGGVEQVIEGGNLLTGTYTLSWTGTATATVAGASVANGGSVSITGGTDTTVRFSSGTFSLVQFEQGTAATPFQLRPIGEELILCQRYYFTRSYAITVTRSSAASQFWSIIFPVQMRATPTTTYSGFVDNDSSGATGMSFSSLSSSGATGFTVSGTTTAGARLVVNTFNTAEL